MTDSNSDLTFYNVETRGFAPHVKRPNVLSLPMYNYEFDNEIDCNSTNTECESGYYGVDESDPFVKKDVCKKIGDYWYPHCVLRSNRLRDDNYVNKFLVDFKPRVKELPNDYMLFIFDICEFNKNSPACKDFNVTMLIGDIFARPDMAQCEDVGQRHCSAGFYANGDYDPVYQYSGCTTNPLNDQEFLSRCTFDNFYSEGDHITQFQQDYASSQDKFKYLFLSGPFCNENQYPFRDPCDQNYSLQITRRNFDTLDECVRNLNFGASNECYAPFSINLLQDDYTPCELSEDGKYRVSCLFKSGTELNANDVSMLQYNFYSGADKFVNEMNYKQILNKYCANPIHRTKSECTFNSHPKCETSPWLSSCGGTGNKCDYTPTTLDCKEPCLSNPWLTECGGTGNKCDYTPDDAECKELCEKNPGSTDCCSFNPSHLSCATINDEHTIFTIMLLSAISLTIILLIK